MKNIVLGLFVMTLLFIGTFFVDIDDNVTKIISYNGNNLRISIDGESSNTLPVNGTYYLADYSCKNNNTIITWNKSTRELTVSNGNKKGGVSCYLEFKSRPFLSEMEPGSYVSYVGDSKNGCDDTNEVNNYTSCSGKNANYVSDADMGHCSTSPHYRKFHVNGWRIGYIEKGSAYLVSAGSLECMQNYIDGKKDSVVNQELSTNYYYGSGYDFDKNTGIFTLTGVTSTPMVWSTSYQSIIDNTPYTCKSTLSTATCTTMYEVVSFYSGSRGNLYVHYNYEQTPGVPIHLSILNSKALKYCNYIYIKNGVCTQDTVWAINEMDFYKIVGKSLNFCYNKFGQMNCGYNNDLIDNGSHYWFATPFSASSSSSFFWNAYRYIDERISSVTGGGGLRPVLHLDPSVVVIGGSGTYEDPYRIGNNTFFVNDGVSILNDDDNLSAVSLELVSSEDVSTMCISVDTSVCTNYVTYSNTYSLDMSSYGTGEKVIYVYYKDSSGNIIASMNKSLTISNGS